MVSDKMIGRILLFFCLFSLSFLKIHAQTKPTPGQIRPALHILDSTKEQDGLVGSVRRVKTEYAKISLKEGQPVEGPRQLLEVTTYGVKGNRVENVSYPIDDSASGREEYKYDANGNIVEKILRDESGAVLSREAYEYVFDDVGNWTKMVSSLVVIENGEEKREPTEVTYRTLTYYARDTVARSVARTASDSVEVKPVKLADTERSQKPLENTANGTATVDSPKSDEVQTPGPTANDAANEKKDEPLIGEVSGSTSTPQSSFGAHALTMRPRVTENSGAVNGSSEKPLRDKPEASNGFTLEPELGPSKTAKKAKTEASGPSPVVEIQSPIKNAESERVAHANPRASTDDSAVTPVNGNGSSTAETSNPIKTSENPSSRSENAAAPKSENAESASTTSSASLTKALEFYRLGRQRFEAGDVSSAIEAYRESVRLEPNSAEIQLNLAHAYLTDKKDKDAAKAFKEAVRLNPELAEAYYGLGFVSFRMTRFRDALEAFKKATVLMPDMARAHYGLALVYQEMGKMDAVIQEYRLLQKLDPKLANRLTQMFSEIDFSCRGSRFCK